MQNNSIYDDTTSKIYDDSGFCRRIGFGKKPAVIVVDMQRGLTEDISPLGMNLDLEIENIAKLLREARCKGIPIFYVVLGYDQDEKEMGHLITKIPTLKYLKFNTIFTEVDPRIKPEEEDVIIRKRFPSSFFGTPLASMLTLYGVDTLIITGMSTSGCIRATTIDTVQHGFRPVVARECVGDRTKMPHESSLSDISAKVGDVSGLDEIIEYIKTLNG